MRLLVFWALFSLLVTTTIRFTAAQSPASSVSGPPSPIKLPVPPSPVDRLRELLRLDQEARARELAKKPVTSRRVIENSLKELDMLTPQQQQVRLRLMELRWEMSRVLSQAPTNRAISLMFIREDDRKLVTERLNYWDKLPFDLQKAVLENEAMLSYFISGQVRSTTELTNRLGDFPPSIRTNLARVMKQWGELTPDQQQKIYANFREVFGLDARDQEKIFRQASLEQGQQIQKVLKSLQKMPPQEQQRCMDSLRKFTSMTVEERAQFLRNAERWQKMPEEDRKKWRTLVRAVPPLPPLPPGFFGQSPHKAFLTNQP